LPNSLGMLRRVRHPCPTDPLPGPDQTGKMPVPPLFWYLGSESELLLESSVRNHSNRKGQDEENKIG